MINITKKPTAERISSSGCKLIAFPVNDIIPDSSVKGKDGKEKKIIKSGERTNKSGDKGEQIETQSIESFPVDDREKMTCHTCKVSGHKYLADCELCYFWYSAKCQHLKIDAMKRLALYGNTHWCCSSCEHNALGMITNAKYSLGKKTPAPFRRILKEMADFISSQS